VQDYLPFIVIGLATGAVYGMAGVGLVLTYKTSGIFNFGYGAIAALIAFLFYYLNVEHGLPWPIAAVMCLGVLAPILAMLLELMARSLEGASENLKVLATVGLILIVEGISLLWHEQNPPTFPNFLPQSTVRMLGVNVTWNQIIIFLFSLAASGALYWFFRSSRLGVVMRGVVDNADLVSMSGDDPIAVRRWAWLLGTIFAGIAGIFLASTQELDGVTLATIVFAAFGAAAIGYFSNLPLTLVGGLLIGVGGALVDKFAGTIQWIGGVPPSLPFLVLFVVLIVMPRWRLVRSSITAPTQVRRPYRAPTRLRLLAGVIVIGLLLIVPAVQATQIDLWSAAMISIILFLSLGLLVRRSGLISLCQLSFAAVGAAAYGHFAQLGLPWVVALILAALTAVPIGAIIAIPAVRVSGVFLALATLGFAIAAAQIFYSSFLMFGSTTLGIAEPRPDFSLGGLNFSTDKGFYYLVLFIAVLVVVAVMALSGGRLGRLLEAMANSPLALRTHGVSLNTLKVIVFCTSAALASLAGALTGQLYQFGVGTYFGWYNSVYIVAVVVMIAIGDPWYAVIAAIAYSVVPGYINGAATNAVLELLFGVGAVTAVYGSRVGMPAAVGQFLDRFGPRKSASAPALGVAPALAAAGAGAAFESPDSIVTRTSISPGTVSDPPGRVEVASPALPAEPQHSNGRPAIREGLTVRNLTVRFGGVIAVDNVSLTARSSMITGLVGPNGAGKTTIFNACSGLNRPTAGQILLHGVDVSHDGPARRARRGLGRTFQRTELFNSLTVRQNVAMGREAPMAGGNPFGQMFGSRRASQTVAAAASAALALTGIEHIADVQAGLLPTGQRRLVELARALAGPFDMILLDEPSAGLDAHETEHFGRILTSVVQERRCGILLVEHDMALVRDICNHVFVLDFGELIFDGTPEEMHRSDQVRAAYLGDADTVIVAIDAAGGTNVGENPSESGD